MKLTLSYAGFLVVAGLVTGLVGLVVLRYVPDTHLQVTRGGGFAPSRSDLLAAAAPLFAAGLGVLALVGLLGGWVLAGRVLRPLEQISRAVRRAGEGSLSHRVALPGRRDELRDLADGLDDVLDRLERAFGEQRRFTANASHELRTPVATVRAMLEVARADPGGRDVEALLARLAEVNDRQAATLEAVLQLAHAERALERTVPCDLVELLEDALGELPADAVVDLDVPATPVLVPGDPVLLEHLVGNLVRNAGLHGWGDEVRAGVRREGPRAVLEISNAGPELDPDSVAALAEPFVRGAGRSRGAGGSGLGLAIVGSVARTHSGTVRLTPRAGGGLTVRVVLPAAPPPS
ncbi:sensor histidine kinase [Kineococcus sp. SYSU DK002]|uniref:sensor histidine kinase n=1 Tax=Kineococcus sp. SYSU DK002 TaxID=3383123 RepID=UPI003D7D0CC5